MKKYSANMFVISNIKHIFARQFTLTNLDTKNYLHFINHLI